MNTKWGSQLGVIIATLLLGATMVQAQGDELLVTDVFATQIQGPGTVFVSYGLETVGDVPVTVTLHLSTDEGVSYPYLCQSVTGDVGAGVLPGTSRFMIWNAGADIPGIMSGSCRVRVTADDLVYIPPGFAYVPSGTFGMGSPEDEPGRETNETLHTVTLTRGFYMAQTEVTEEWWDDVMGAGTSTSRLPKTHVSWDDCVAFCNELSLNEGLTPAYTINGANGDATWNRAANGFRLPTEAEWECASRAGSLEPFCIGPITSISCSPLDPILDQLGWYCGNSGGAVHEVGQKSANAWGLYDLHGSLYEWVWDGYRVDYQNLSTIDPAYDVGPGANRVIHGASWEEFARYCRSAYRFAYGPLQVGLIGFRPVRTAF